MARRNNGLTAEDNETLMELVDARILSEMSVQPDDEGSRPAIEYIGKLYAIRAKLATKATEPAAPTGRRRRIIGRTARAVEDTPTP